MPGIYLCSTVAFQTARTHTIFSDVIPRNWEGVTRFEFGHSG
jgi:hypothetical protein